MFLLGQIALHGADFLWRLTEAAAFGVLGVFADRFAFGAWKQHIPHQMHYRRAAIVIAFVLAGLWRV